MGAVFWMDSIHWCYGRSQHFLTFRGNMDFLGNEIAFDIVLMIGKMMKVS